MQLVESFTKNFHVKIFQFFEDSKQVSYTSVGCRASWRMMKTLDSHWKKREKYWKNRSSGPCSPHLKNSKGSEFRNKTGKMRRNLVKWKFGRNQQKMVYFVN